MLNNFLHIKGVTKIPHVLNGHNSHKHGTKLHIFEKLRTFCYRWAMKVSIWTFGFWELRKGVTSFKTDLLKHISTKLFPCQMVVFKQYYIIIFHLQYYIFNPRICYSIPFERIIQILGRIRAVLIVSSQ